MYDSHNKSACSIRLSTKLDISSVYKIAYCIKFALIIVFGFTLSSCWHYNYAADKEKSDIPYNNQYHYAGDTPKKYEFESTLYKLDPKRRGYNYVTLMHLNDISNLNNAHLTTNNIWRKSRLTFNFNEDSGVELIPDSVVLEHYSQDGTFYAPEKIVSGLKACSKKIGCYESLVLHYDKKVGEKMPKQLVEKVSFSLIVNGKEEPVTHTIPLVYKYDYSDLGVFMSR